jgi:poly(hydroxyalkanoate) depolymerase family esterase
MRILIISIFLPLFGLAQSVLLEVESFGDNPAGMKMFLHASKGLGATYSGVLLVLHGCTQGAETLSRESGWNKLADSANMLVIYANQALLNNPSRCFNWFLPAGNTRNGSEVRSLMSMIDYVETELHLPQNQVVVFGLSAGACMALNLGILYPERFKAIAAIAAVPLGREKDPMRKITAVLYQEEVDEKAVLKIAKERMSDTTLKLPRLILAQGGKDQLVNPAESEAIARQWLYAQGQDSGAVEGQIISEKPSVSTRNYLNSEGESLVICYSIHDLGHALAIDVGNGSKQGGMTGLWTKDIDFHLPYWIAKEFGWKTSE